MMLRESICRLSPSCVISRPGPRRVRPKGTLYNYPPRRSARKSSSLSPRAKAADLVASIACAPARPRLPTQLYSQATMTKMIARCTQQGESIDQAIAWASDEIEGFMRG
jgi:hypothetical protein